MPEDDSDSWEVRFLKANANKDYMSGVLADCIRNCMRGVASGDSWSATYKASQDFSQLLKLMRYAESDVTITQLFVDAINEIRPARDDDIGNSETFAERYFESSKLMAATTGIQFIVEPSCHDNAARGRTGRRESEFLDSLRRIDEARAEMRAHWEKRESNSQASPRNAAERKSVVTKPATAKKSPRSRPSK